MVAFARETIRQLILDAEKFVEKEQIIPPVTLDELQHMADKVVRLHPEYEELGKWVLVMLNNALWRDYVAGIPYKRRILLLPHCLRDAEKCKAKVDPYGLVCEACGACDLSDLLYDAENLGMMCLVAEGSAIVADLIESGSVDAIIGVSCFTALEKAFPYMVRHAVPGMALPLFSDGCKDTETDVPLLKSIYLRHTGKPFPKLDLPEILNQVRAWFSESTLETIMGEPGGPTDVLARQCLLQEGKRYRPFLCVALAESLGPAGLENLSLKKLAVAVECFHKASLIHDDIEDDDTVRNGEPTLHAREGVAVALNVGDLLIGEGYRLVSEVDVAPDRMVRLLRAAADGHLTLCRGQGEELLQRKNPAVPDLEGALAIFARKTAPAFNVAFQFGALFMNADEMERDILRRFSQYLGTAYQILDDLDDPASRRKRPKGKPARSEAKKTAPRKRSRPGDGVHIIEVLQEHEGLSLAAARTRARELVVDQRTKALLALRPLRHFRLKRLLFQITSRILPDAS